VKLPADDVRAALAADGEFATAARYWTAAVRLDLEADSYRLEVDGGRVAAFRAASDTDQAPDVVLAGPDADWARILAPVPPPFFHDVLSGPRFGFHRVTVTGDELSEVFPYYHAIQRLIDVIRTELHGPPPGREAAAATAPAAERAFDSAVGRYAYLTVAGVRYRVYFEEAGQGLPLLLQHTAGSDGRQFRHLLEDAELQRRFRMIAYDLPWHGKSNPPPGRAWWTEPYQLTRDFLLEFVTGFARVLQLDKPVFCGCSIGGLLAPDLALTYPGDFRAVIALNGIVKTGSTAPDEVMGRSWFDPRLAADWHAAWMLGRTSPLSPEAYRRETAWYYAQAGPGVLAGDLHYYQHEHDLEGQLAGIDTGKCPVYVVAGEYDPSRVARFGARPLADGIPGAHYGVAPGAGHFMMSEDPDRFRSVIVPILGEIAARG
jgi:pimeloyl-ACP methyl ester carboxylesterase